MPEERQNPEGRAVAEFTALVGARVVGEHLHPAIVERFTCLEGELTVKRNGEVLLKPPAAVQRVVFSTLGPIARWRGYRATYPELSRVVLAPRTDQPETTAS